MRQRLLYSGLIAVTLVLGVAIGTVVFETASATQQQPAPLVVPDPVQLTNGFGRIAEQVGPAVVNIDVESPAVDPARQFGDLFEFFPNPFGIEPPFEIDPDQPEEPMPRQSTGSGFVVDPAGYIITNNHVIEEATKIIVSLDDDSEFEAEVVGTDEETDLAVIKIETDRDLPVAPMGNSDAAQVGDWVLALGSPFGFDQSLTAGIVSAKGRDVPGGEAFQRFIQTDAAINPGNSGGPLVNMAGEVIGVNTAIISNTRQFAGLGFAMPSNVVVDVYNQIVTQGRVSRGFIGIQMNPDSSSARAFGVERGVVVDDVTPGGPSDLAGMRSGDVIIAVNGQTTGDNNELLQAVASQRVGETVPIRVVREGEELTLNVTIADRAEGLAASRGERPAIPRNGDAGESETSLGIRVRAIPAQVRALPGGRELTGVMVVNVEPDSVAADAGLQRDMIISQIAAARTVFDIETVDDFAEVTQGLESGTTIAFRVHIRSDQTGEFIQTYLPVTIP